MVGTKSLRVVLEVKFTLHKENPEFLGITPIKPVRLLDFSAGSGVGRRASEEGPGGHLWECLDVLGCYRPQSHRRDGLKH